ncbi:MAG: sigma 54-interacting transcriptional regulator [Myxococcota bacterium]
MSTPETESVTGTRVLSRGRDQVWVHRTLHLEVESGVRSGERIALVPGELRFGSGPDADFFLEDEAVSALHFALALGDDGVWLTDLNSTNGTRVDGVRVSRAELHRGARVRAGTTVLRLEVGEDEESVPLSGRTNFGGLLGHSTVMRSAFAILEQVAKSNATVLIQGESGTGKELAARGIHQHSPRSAGPYVVFDCGAASPTLIESLLFGHVKGAFTGASDARSGVFEEADGGTLVLDEIGELPLELQPKLLRALESKTVQRIGETKPRSCNLRFVASTHRNLAEAVRAGTFREDLFFRLSVITVRLPALRERREEIPRLAAHFLAQLGGDSAPEFSAETLRLLEAHDWPGNVRELRNVVERFVALPGLSPTQALGLSDPGPTAADAQSPQRFFDLSYHDAKSRWLDELERSYLAHHLREASGNVSEVARTTDLARQSVHRLIKKHGLDDDP